MKSKILRVAVILLILASVFGLTYLVMYSSIKSSNSTSSTNLSSKQLAAENSTTVIGSNEFGVQHSRAPILEAINKDGKSNVNKFYVPRENGRVILCIEHQGTIKAKGNTREELKEIFDERYADRVSSSRHDCASGTKTGIRSNTYYSCVGDHSVAYPDLAYLITEPEDAKYVVPDTPSDAVIEQTRLYQEIIRLYNDYEDYMEANQNRLGSLYEELFIKHYRGNDGYREDVDDGYSEYRYNYREDHGSYRGAMSKEEWLKEEFLPDYRPYENMKELIEDSNSYEDYYSYYKYCFEEDITPNATNYTYNDFLVQVFMEIIEDNTYDGEDIFKAWIDEIPQEDLENGIIDYLPSYEGAILYKYSAGEVIGEDIKQIAVWLRDGSRDGISNNKLEITSNSILSKYYSQEDLATVPFYDIATKLLEESKNYEEFGNKLSDDESNAIRLEDTTNYDDVKVSVNTEAEPAYFTVGPFTMNYVEGTYGNATFGGIANMYMEGYNADGELVKAQIPVDYFLLGEEGEEAIVPDYFTPSIDDKRYVDYTEQGYPKSGQTFYIKVKNPNRDLKGSDRIKNVKVKIEFQWMRATGEVCYLEGGYDEIVYKSCYHTDHCCDSDHEDCDDCCYTCHYDYKIKKQTYEHQNAIDAWGTRKLYSLTKELTQAIDIQTLGLTMELGGKVWQDEKSTKETVADGLYVESNKEESDEAADDTVGDILLPNVKVTLYEYDENTGKSSIAELIVPEDKNKIDDEEVKHNINPTLTDENGEYLFKGVDSTKKYYVTFEYNGQVYMPTEYMVHGKTEVNGAIELEQYKSLQDAIEHDNYNTENWEITSKGTEAFDEDSDITMDRGSYDEQFEEIGSNPRNYKSTNSLSINRYLIRDGRDYYNESFSRLDLMGYTLNRDGKYEYDESKQLMDGYKYDKDGLITTRYSEGVITQRIKEYIEENKIYPDEDAMMDIYTEIVRESDSDEEEMWRKIQFIEDCKIEAYTGSPLEEGEIDIYPAFDNFVIDDKDRVVDHRVEHAIYPGQYYINLGLWQRQEFDMALRKDVYKATLKINNKTVIYNYDKRKTEEEGYWDINVRMSDYEAYYNTGYNREIYETDYLFNTNEGIASRHPGEPLEIYITYKITIRNQSQTVLGQIQEVVDYYDKDYELREDLSWITYIGGSKNNTISADEYYNAMVEENVDIISNARNIKCDEDSKYGDETHGDIAGSRNSQYNSVYVTGLEDKKLASGESAYIYLTFQVRKENERVILDGGEYSNSDTPKENIAEINGYKTYYKDDTELPNDITKDSDDIAGLLDRDSNPGNLNNIDIRDNDRYEKNFEDDTDRAPSLRVIIDEDATREANGYVWEDERTENVEESIIGDGIRDKDETGVSGVTVQLVEKCIDGSEYIWREVKTNGDGRYDIVRDESNGYYGYIPGDYVIRFQYGDTDATALSTESKGAQGENIVSYNGQDFKSTIYQEGIDQEGATDESERYQGYIHTDTQNESGQYNPEKGRSQNDTYGYNINKADHNDTDYSDAKDIWSRREEVINYSKDNVTNHVAEVLASPYEVPEYNGTQYSDEDMRALYEELKENTKMVAETGIIAVEFEYDRQQTDGDNSYNNGDYLNGNEYNGKYTLNNVDLGLVERPKAQLEMDKSVANVKVTLANGSILFDINKAANNALWQDHKEYELDKHKKDGKYEEYYGEEDKHRYSYRTESAGLGHRSVNDIVNTTDKGLIQLTMDEELMHGATIQITYALKVTNVGEIDYVDGTNKDFYYNGEATEDVVTTTANQIIDYVANNLQFDANNETNANDKWQIITVDNLTTGNNNLVNDKLTDDLKKLNTIIQTESFGEELVPGQEVSKTLILSQLITPENTNDDLTYSNMAEIVKTSNTVGRRMAYSVVGNQNPSAENASEIDTSVAEKIIILPPFGEERIYYILGATVAIILIGGIILIRRKVLKGKNK